MDPSSPSFSHSSSQSITYHCFLQNPTFPLLSPNVLSILNPSFLSLFPHGFRPQSFPSFSQPYLHSTALPCQGFSRLHSPQALPQFRQSWTQNRTFSNRTISRLLPGPPFQPLQAQLSRSSPGINQDGIEFAAAEEDCGGPQETRYRQGALWNWFARRRSGRLRWLQEGPFPPCIAIFILLFVFSLVNIGDCGVGGLDQLILVYG